MFLPGNFFRCVVCDATQLVIGEAEWSCSECSTIYPVERGIPLLVRDSRSHLERLARAAEENPEWYVVEHPAEEESPWRHHLRKRRLFVESVLRNYLNGHDGRVADELLDLACGDGQNLAFLSQFTSDLYGCDYNPVRLARAESNRSTSVEPTLFLGDVLDMPVGDSSFEIVFFNHGLEHIAEDERALANLYRILAPGGLLILGTPNEGAWWWRLAYKLEPEIRRSTDHVQFYTSASLVEKMTGQGFRIIQTEHMGWGPPHWKLDYFVRRYKLVDDFFEFVGRRLFKKQASSLYVIATKD